MFFGKKLKELRRKKGMTQKEVAVRLGIPPSTYRQWEEGTKPRDFTVLKKISALYEIPIEYLIERR
jgi:transcriptional regulator with XRE-family HTH domain